MLPTGINFPSFTVAVIATWLMLELCVARWRWVRAEKGCWPILYSARPAGRAYSTLQAGILAGQSVGSAPLARASYDQGPEGQASYLIRRQNSNIPSLQPRENLSRELVHTLAPAPEGEVAVHLVELGIEFAQGCPAGLLHPLQVGADRAAAVLQVLGLRLGRSG